MPVAGGHHAPDQGTRGGHRRQRGAEKHGGGREEAEIAEQRSDPGGGIVGLVRRTMKEGNGKAWRGGRNGTRETDAISDRTVLNASFKPSDVLCGYSLHVFNNAISYS
jgi:hypothetical protein